MKIDIDKVVRRKEKKPRNYTRKQLAAKVAYEKREIRKQNKYGKVTFGDWTVFIYPEKGIFELRIPFQVTSGKGEHDVRNCIYCANI